MEKAISFTADKVFKRTLRMNNGLSIPQIGLGTYKIKINEPYYWALKYGYRMFDSAAFYGNEPAIAEQIRKGFNDFGLKREDIYLCSKVPPGYQGYDKSKKIIDKSLKNFDLEYIDMMMIHHPSTHGLKPSDPQNIENRHGTWRALEEYVQKGLIKSIGVSNFRPTHLDQLIKVANIKPAINQFELHPLYVEYDTVEVCRRHEILIQCYSPFAQFNKQLIENEVIIKIAQNHNIDVARTILVYLTQKGHIVLPKSVHEERIANNIQFEGITLSQDEMHEIDELGRQNSMKVAWNSDDVV